MISLKVRENACFATNNSPSILAAAITGRYQDNAVRPLQNFSPDRWGDRFLTLPFTNSLDDSSFPCICYLYTKEFESCSSQVESMKKMVKDMLMSSRDDPIENILLINSLFRLGVSYHFEIEIKEQLSHLFLTFSIDNNDYDLYTIAVVFQEFESCSSQVESMKKMVKDMLMSSRDDPIENILLINSLFRLGVSYHFEIEIQEQLSNLFLTFSIDSNDYDLYTVAVVFQVFRSHGYKMSCDVFNKFKNDDGMFKEELASNTKGIISLYEACQWGMHQEHILDEALTFTTLHLESLLSSRSCPDHLREYIGNALKFPYHKGMPRLESKQYISYYGNEESRNDLLLKFAKYDFNRVQMLHQKELSLLSSWWQKANLASRFPHVRQRMVESFFMAVAMVFEPQFAFARNLMSKWYIGFALIDDTYDAYGLYQELQALKRAVERWDTSAVDELPGEYLRNLYEAFLHISDEVEEAVRKEGRSSSVFYAKEAIKKLVQGYHVDARWLHENIMPRFDEYLENGVWSIGVNTTLAVLMMGMREADEDAYRWLLNCDATILRAVSLQSRHYNDMQSNEDEEGRGGQISGITCYMKEYGVSKEEAMEGFRERIKAAWKDINEGFMETPMSIPFPRRILMTAFNIARVSEVCYKYDDGFTYPEITYKHYITKVLIDPIPLEE
ncbi:hypothetical protein GQ457_12G026080 [Hibiscus cannabinus]